MDGRAQPEVPPHAAAFRRDGFAVVRGMFDAGEVDAMARAFDRQRAQAGKAGRRDGNTVWRVVEDPAVGRIVRMVQWPAYVDAVLDRVRLDRRLCQLVRPLIDADLKQIINQLHWKPPGAAAEFGYHQDIRFRRPRHAYRDAAANYVQTGIAIDPHTLASGAMRVIPGSHRLGELAIGGSEPVMQRPLADRDLAAAGIDPAAAITLDLAPGDVALWHLHLVHGSGPNRADGDRRFYLNGYVRADTCLRGEWAFRGGEPCPLGAPVLVHWEDLYRRPVRVA